MVTHSICIFCLKFVSNKKVFNIKNINLIMLKTELVYINFTIFYKVVLKQINFTRKKLFKLKRGKSKHKSLLVHRHLPLSAKIRSTIWATCVGVRRQQCWHVEMRSQSYSIIFTLGTFDEEVLIGAMRSKESTATTLWIKQTSKQTATRRLLACFFSFFFTPLITIDRVYVLSWKYLPYQTTQKVVLVRVQNKRNILAVTHTHI